MPLPRQRRANRPLLPVLTPAPSHQHAFPHCAQWPKRGSWPSGMMAGNRRELIFCRDTLGGCGLGAPRVLVTFARAELWIACWRSCTGTPGMSPWRWTHIGRVLSQEPTPDLVQNSSLGRNEPGTVQQACPGARIIQNREHRNTLLDTVRNSPQETKILPHWLRPRPQPTASWPRGWECSQAPPRPPLGIRMWNHTSPER